MALLWLVSNNGSLIPSSGALAIIIKELHTQVSAYTAHLPFGTVINDDRFSGGLGGLRLLFLVLRFHKRW